jgi:hypothetical protein
MAEPKIENGAVSEPVSPPTLDRTLHQTIHDAIVKARKDTRADATCCYVEEAVSPTFVALMSEVERLRSELEIAQQRGDGWRSLVKEDTREIRKGNVSALRGGRVHLRIGRIGEYACGVGKRWSSQDVTSTTSPASVTCRSCQRSCSVLAAHPEDT